MSGIETFPWVLIISIWTGEKRNCFIDNATISYILSRVKNTQSDNFITALETVERIYEDYKMEELL